MEKAKRKSQSTPRFNFQHKCDFEFVTELRLEECVARLGGKIDDEVQRLIPRSNLLLTMKPVRSGQVFQFSLHSTVQNLEVGGAGSIEKLSDDRTQVRGEAGLDLITALLLTFLTVVIGIGMAGILLFIFLPASPLPVLLMYAMWRMALNTRNSIIDHITGTLLLEKPKRTDGEVVESV